MTTNFALLLQAPAQPGGGMMMPLMMVGMIVVMYFFMIRPQQKKAKEAKAFADSITTGERIVTTAGIHGRIVRTNDDGTVEIEIARNTTVVIERQAISMEMTKAYLAKNPTKANTTVTATAE